MNDASVYAGALGISLLVLWITNVVRRYREAHPRQLWLDAQWDEARRWMQTQQDADRDGRRG